MAQEDILNLVNGKINKLWSSREIKDNLNLTSSSIVQSLKSIRTTDWLGYISYKDVRFYYYSTQSTKFDNIPRVITIQKGVKGLHKKNIIQWLYDLYGIELQEV